MARNVGVNSLECLGDVHLGKVHRGSELNVTGKFLVSLIVPVVQRTAFELNDSGKPVKVSNRSGSSNFCAEPVAADSGHGYLVLIHPANDVGAHILHIVRGVVIGVALVSVVQKPDVSDVCDFVVGAGEEGLEVVNILNELGQPDECRHIVLLVVVVDMGASELDGSRVGNTRGL